MKANSSVEFLMLESTNRKQITTLLETIKQNFLPEATKDTEKRFNMIVAGMPNVGKSTIINRLRAVGTSIGGKAVRIGGVPGITRAVSEYVKISPFPKIYLLDTPGVLMPKITDPEVGLKIALCGGMLDRVVGDYVIAEYLLYILNARENRRYLEVYEMSERTDKLQNLLPKIAEKTGQMQNGTMNLVNTIGIFLRHYRTGLFGRFSLDEIPK